MEYQQFSLKSSCGNGSLALKLISLISLAFLVVGCGGKNVKQSVLDVYEIQKPVQVRTSLNDDRPDWTHMTSFEDEGNVYFSGGFQNGSDYSVTVRCANAEALKSAVQAISQFIRAEFSSYVHGSNTGGYGIDRYVSDGLSTFSHCLHMQVRQSEVFYEENFSPSVMQPTFNVWVKIQMSKADYLHAKADVIRRLREGFSRSGETEAKEKANKLLDELKEEAKRYGA